jgi:hypothetical protein
MAIRLPLVPACVQGTTARGTVLVVNAWLTDRWTSLSMSNCSTSPGRFQVELVEAVDVLLHVALSWGWAVT